MKQLKKLSFQSKLSREEQRQIKGGVTACHCTCTTGVGSWIEYHKGQASCTGTYSPWCAEGTLEGSGNVVCTGVAGS